MSRAALLLVCALAGVSATASAGTAGLDSPRWRLGLGPTAGVLALDPHLVDYRWDIRPTAQTGLAATVQRGRFALGGRFWRAHTSQATGVPGDERAPRVNLTGVEAVGAVRALRYGVFELWGTGHGGSFHIGYDPDRLTFDLGGAQGSVTVDYAPITEWAAGLGLELRAGLTRQLCMSVQGGGTTFFLDTAHRSGGEIIESRERFVSWSLTIQVSWLMGLG